MTSGSTRRITLPPGTPLPPSGPPSGLNFSRCTEATPLPPRPAVTFNVTRSTNVGTAIGLLLSGWGRRFPGCPVNRAPSRRCNAGGVTVSLGTQGICRYGEGAPCVSSRAPLRGGRTSSGPRSLGGRDDVHDTPTTLGAELDVSADQREQGVVAAAADAAAGVEV